MILLIIISEHNNIIMFAGDEAYVALRYGRSLDGTQIKELGCKVNRESSM